MPNKILRVSNLDLYDPLKKKLLSKLGFEVEKGQALRIVGENGTGKTALLRAIFSNYKHFRGEVVLSQKDFSYLPQLSPRRPKLPINLGEICGREYPFFTSQIMERPLVGASGGERKRAMLAKIFSEEKELVVLDEPLNHLDAPAIKQVGQWLQEYIERGGTLIYTGHTGTLPQTQELDLHQWKC